MKRLFIFSLAIALLAAGCATTYRFQDMTIPVSTSQQFRVQKVIVEDRRLDKNSGNVIAGLGGSANIYYTREKQTLFSMEPGYFGIFENYVGQKIVPIFPASGHDISIRLVLKRFIKYTISPGAKSAPFIGFFFMGMKDTYVAELTVDVELLDAAQSPIFFKQYEERAETRAVANKYEYTAMADELISQVLDHWGQDVARDIPLYKRMARPQKAE